MSGWKNTFGDYANDKVVAYIVDKLEKVDAKKRRAVIKLIQQMARDRAAVQSLSTKTIEDFRTRNRFARMVEETTQTDIHVLSVNWYSSTPELSGSEITGVATRLRNLCDRNYKEVTNASTSPICFLCKNLIRDSFELYEKKKVHKDCFEERMRADYGIY